MELYADLPANQAIGLDYTGPFLEKKNYNKKTKTKENTSALPAPLQ